MFKIAKYIIGAWLAAGASEASAGDVPQDVADSMMRSCRADYHRICPDVVPGSGRASMCLLDHETELSAACLQAVKTAHAIEVCSPDYRRYCEGAKGLQAMECLAGRMEALQPECRRIVAANAPYMNRQPGRYAYGGPAPYGPPSSGPYAYRAGPEDEDRYSEEGGPNGPYGTYPYPGRFGPGGAYPYPGRPAPEGAFPYSSRPGPDGAYAYPGRPTPDGIYPFAGRPGPGPEERYAGENERRFRSYDDRSYSDRNAGRNGPQRDDGRNAPGEREAPDEERE
jgi:hypothetical protein